MKKTYTFMAILIPTRQDSSIFSYESVAIDPIVRVIRKLLNSSATNI